MVITFSDQEQQKIEGIVIDKDGEEALRYLGDLVHKFKSQEGHACGPKAAEGPPGHG
jgi:hypothetical protein